MYRLAMQLDWMDSSTASNAPGCSVVCAMRRTRGSRLRLTALGEERIAELTELHLVELSRLAPVLRHLVMS